MPSPDPRRVVRASLEKIAGEVRFIKDKSDDSTSWAWANQGTTERVINENFVFNAKNLKPLAQTLRSALMALGHATSAHARFVKIKSRNISPDGALGGRGYTQKIPEIRRQLMNCVEVLSALTDTLYDEVQAPHWAPSEDKMTPRDRDEVIEIVEEVEAIKEDPEEWAVEEEEEEVGAPTAQTASMALMTHFFESPEKRGDQVSVRRRRFLLQMAREVVDSASRCDVSDQVAYGRVTASLAKTLDLMKGGY